MVRRMETRPVREIPGWQVVRLLKRRGVRQQDVAQRAGTSGGTVSQAIHRSPKVSKPLADRIWAAIEEMVR